MSQRIRKLLYPLNEPLDFFLGGVGCATGAHQTVAGVAQRFEHSGRIKAAVGDVNASLCQRTSDVARCDTVHDE